MSSVKFAELPQLHDAAPVVLAEVNGEAVLWSSQTATWSCTCAYRPKKGKTNPTCPHVVQVGRSLPVAVANHLARALIAAGHGSSTVSRERLTQ